MPVRTFRVVRQAVNEDRWDPRTEPAEERRSRFFSAATLQDSTVSPREWLVEGLIPSRTVTLLGGDGGTGKSLLALQLAVSVATGCRWLGMPVAPGRALYLSAEDDADELHRRLDAIVRALGTSYHDLGGLTLRSLAGENALLAHDTSCALAPTSLLQEVEAHVAAERPALIVLDTLADMYPANENDRAKVRQFIGLLRGLALRHDCAVLLLAHPSLSGLTSGSGTSGSTAWSNSVRSRLYLSRITENGYEADPDRRRLTTMKANYGPVGGEVALRWKEGVFQAEAAPQSLDRLAAGAKAERVFLKLLDQFAAEGRYVNHKGASTYAPAQFAKHPEAEGVTKSAFTAAMNALLGKRTIVIDEKGPPSRRTSFLRRATP